MKAEEVFIFNYLSDIFKDRVADEIRIRTIDDSRIFYVADSASLPSI